MSKFLIPATPDQAELPSPPQTSSPPNEHTTNEDSRGPTQSQYETQKVGRSFGDSYELDVFGSAPSHSGTGNAQKQLRRPTHPDLSSPARRSNTVSTSQEADTTSDRPSGPNIDASDARSEALQASTDSPLETGDFGETQHPQSLRTNEEEDAEDPSGVLSDGVGEISMVMATAEPKEVADENTVDPTRVDESVMHDHPEDVGEDKRIVNFIAQPTPSNGDLSLRPIRTAARTSHATFDEPSAPSSSAVVARDLLSPKKAGQAGNGNGGPPPSSALTEPQSSADPDLTTSFLLSPLKKRLSKVDQSGQTSSSSGRSKGGSAPNLAQSRGDASGSFSGPETSTPAIRGAPLPRPLTGTRTLPAFTYPGNQTLPEPIIPPLNTLKSAQKALYQSSTALNNIAPKPAKVLREAWDGLSDDSADEEDEEEQEDETMGEKDMTMDQTQASNQDASQRSGAVTPRPTADANATLDMDMDEDESFMFHQSIGAKEESLEKSIGASAPPPAHQPTAPSPAESSLPRRPAFQATPVFGPDLDNSQSQSQSMIRSALGQAALFNDSLPDSLPDEDSHGTTSKRLSDISELKSSMEGQEASQITIEATQAEYDVEVFNRTAGSSSGGAFAKSSDHGPFLKMTADGYSCLDVSQNRDLPSFLHETTTTDNSSHRRSIPLRGRELSRRPPPPSSLPPAVESQLVDPTQLDDSTSLPFPTSTLIETQSEETESPEIPLRLAAASLPPPAIPPPPQSSTSFKTPFIPKKPTEPQPPSSPPVPLATTSLARLSTANSSHPHSTPSTGIVPDSQVPSDEPAEPAAPVQASTSSDAAASPSSPKAIEPRAFYAPEVEETTTATEMGSKGPEPEEKDELDEDVDVIAPVLTTSKGTGKGKVPAKSKGPQGKKNDGKKERVAQAPSKGKLKKKPPGRPPKEKGKGRAHSNAPDEEDVAINDEPAIAEEEPFEETNYEDPPHARRTSRRASAASAPSPAKSKAAGKRRQSTVEDDDPPPPPPKKQKAALKKKAVEALPTGATKPLAKKRGRPAKSASTSNASVSASASVEPENAIAGPSRVRFEEADEDVAMGDETIESKDKASVKGKFLEPRLPKTAPFTRVFGYWERDSYFYPCTIVEVIKGGTLKVQYDDGSRGTLRYAEARRCELEEDDWLMYRGDDFHDPETQEPVLLQEVRVIRVERNTSGVDAVGELFRDDVVLVTPGHADPAISADERKMARMTVDAVTIPAAFSRQLDNRKLSPADIAGLEGRIRKAAKPLKLLSFPEVEPVTPVEVNRIRTGLFSGIGFLVTWTPSTENGAAKQGRKEMEAYEEKKAAYIRTVKKHGGTILDLEQLFDVVPKPDSTDVVLRFHPDSFAGLETILLVTDHPRSTPKYLVALAVGIPCVSTLLVPLSIKSGALLDWRMFTLTAGESKELEAHIIGGQFRSITKSSFALASISAAVPEGIFANSSILLVFARKGKKTYEYMERIQSHRRILAAAGATKIHAAASSEDASTAVDYTYVLLDAVYVTKALQDHPGVRSVDWMKGCLIAGRILDETS
ncbi:hypothetical protein P7C70_g2298, partial [Phenoliferia sp. Uapishka_3]